MPSYGGLGGMPLFSHTGPLSRTVRDAALMLSVIAGPDRGDAAAIRDPAPDFLAALDRPRDRQRVAFAANPGGAPIDPEVRSAFEAAVATFADLGYDLEEAAPPNVVGGKCPGQEAKRQARYAELTADLFGVT